MYYTSFLHFSCHIKEDCAEFLLFETFCSLFRNENIKRPGFYTLQVTRVFSNFPATKKNKKYVWVLQSFWIVICLSWWRSEIVIKKRYWDYVSFRLLRLFSSIVVPTVQNQPPEAFFKKRCSVFSSEVCEIFKGALIQIWKSPNIFVFISNNTLKISHS